MGKPSSTPICACTTSADLGWSASVMPSPLCGNTNATVCAIAHSAMQLAAGTRATLQVIMPYRAPADGSPLASWTRDLNTVHKWVRPS